MQEIVKMHLRKWLKFGGIAAGTIGLAQLVKSFLPQRFDTQTWYETGTLSTAPDLSTFPHVEIKFLRCGSTTIPEAIAVRGGSFAPTVISYSAVLVRHPKATFMYDTGLCSAIFSYLAGQPLLFRKTLANFAFEQSLLSHLRAANLSTGAIDFALLSHLHWDHVSGIPDIPGVPLRVNRVEYDAALLGLLDANGGLVRRLMGNNTIELFDCNGPAYEGFRSSHDLFGDGSVVLVPLPGHTAGNTGMFINRSNGPRLFLIGDAAWVSQNYLRPATMHPFIWSAVTSDDASARQTLIQLHHFALRHPEIPVIAMHDAAMQEKNYDILDPYPGQSFLEPTGKTGLAPASG
jgi:glyoxylase-like metal-dependent hydrolase (beta-lactamase superfamily II)